MKMNKIIQGDCLTVLYTLDSESVDMCMTSPPYWGLRDYGIDGQYGLESTPEEYIEKMTGVFHEVKRVLKKEGTLWLNMGDTHSGGGSHHGDKNLGKNEGMRRFGNERINQTDLPPKCLCMIPERLAWSLIEDGWILRNKIIWYKPNAMPSSVKDRFSNKWEYLFLFSKSKQYYFDLDAIREPFHYPERIYNPDTSNHVTRQLKEEGNRTTGGLHDGRTQYGDPDLGKNPGDVFEVAENRKGLRVPGQSPHGMHRKRHSGYYGADGESLVNPLGANPGDFWSIPTQPFPEAHFAVFPEKLCEKPIKAGCPEGGTVLDPFCGVGTTCYVAKEMKRNYIGIDINAEYIKLNDARLAQGVL